MIKKKIRASKCVFCGSSRFTEIISNENYKILKCLDCSLDQTLIFNVSFFKTNKMYLSAQQAKKHFETQKAEFSSISKNVLDLIHTKSGKFLDIGCGLGWVVAEAEKRGFDATGIDSSKVYTDLGKKKLDINLLARSLETFRTKERFDVIVLNHVLEHVKDPVKFLKKISTLMKPGGELLIATPNIRSLMFWIFREKWYGLQPGQHISQFSPDSIVKVIEKAGLIVHDITSGCLYYNPINEFKKLVIYLLTDLGELFGLGDQLYVSVRKTKE